MRRNATLSLDDLDPDVLDAARDVARRAGMPLETWIESVVGPKGAPPSGPAPAVAQTRQPAQPAAERRRRRRDPSHEGGTHHAREQAGEPVPAAPHSEPVVPGTGTATDGPGGASIGAMMRRLDALDGAPARERGGSDDATARAIERLGSRLESRLESRLATALEGAKPADEMVERLAEIERRMSELGASLAAPQAIPQAALQAESAARPPGRRGRPLAEEMRAAVEQVRLRQRELDADGTAPAALPEASPARPSAPAAAPEPSPAITDLQRETSRLRESLGSLATGRDVGALEEAMRTLAADVQRARAPADLDAIAAPIELIRGQVESLAEEVAANVHARVSGEVARLADKVEGALTSQTASNADRGALDSVFRELDEIRRLIGSLAGPERIQGLAQGLQSISAQISQLQGGLQDGMARGAPAIDALKPLLEEIRRNLKAPDASKAILGRLDALADKVDRANAANAAGGVNPVGDLIGRLEHLGESLRRPAPQDAELANIQRMLRGLAEKVDHVGSQAVTGAGAQNLDGLEKQVVAIARRLDARPADPAVAGLERMMKDLLGQVATLREGNAVEAAVERATRRAFAENQRPEHETPGIAGSAVEQLRADLDALGSRQIAADQRIQATLGNLNSVLERLVDRLDRPAAPIALPEERPLAERLSASASTAAMAAPAQAEPAAEPSTARQPRRPEAPRPAMPEAARLGDELLEPGAGRPRRATAPASPSPDAAKLDTAKPEAPKPILPGGDIKANFIAAARRAAQAAQAEIETPVAAERRSERVRGRAPAETPAPAAGNATGGVTGNTAGGLVTRLRGEIDRRRKPLLLGLASVVLVLGAYQALEMSGEPASEPSVAADVPPSAPAAKLAEAPPAAEPAQQAAPQASSQGSSQGSSQASLQTSPPPSAAKPAPADPQTTQSIAPSAAAPVASSTASSAAPRPAATAPTIPRVAGMDALKADLASVPAPLSSLRQAALDGEGAAVFELAARQADGRGVARDLGIAAKLYEKLAEAGYAPAQFKLGSAYEKGSGVVRNLDQAKAWYSRAAEQGNIRSMHNLAVLYAENPAANGKPDFATASSWFRRAAEYGVRDSQYNLAVLCARGLGMNQDLIQSYGWFSAAAAQGDDEAGRKRDDVAGKLSPKDLATAKSAAASFKAKPAEPAANEVPAGKPAAPSPVSLLGAPPPGSPTSNGFTPSRPGPSPAGV